MTKLSIQAITVDYGCVVYTTISVSNDYTMNEVVKAVKENGYRSFRIIDTMNRFVDVQ